MSRYLFISPHCDDHEISCGGTIAKLVENGHKVFVDALSWCGNDKLILEYENATLKLGADLFKPGGFTVREFDSKRLADYFYVIKNSYDFVFTTSPLDRHDDHRKVGEQARRIFNGNLVNYMCPFNGDLSPNYFVELSEQHIQKKIEALKCYKSQSHRSYMSEEFIRSWAIVNGLRAGVKYAESFKIERFINIGT